MQPKILLTCFVITFLFSGCYTTGNFGFVDLQVMEPALISLPDSIVDMAVVDFHRSPESTTAGLKTNVDSVFAAYASASLQGFKAQTDSIPFFNRVTVVPGGLENFPTGLLLPDSVLHQKLSAYCDSLGVQALIGLDTIWISDNSPKNQVIKEISIGSRWCFFNALGKSDTYWRAYADTMLWFATRYETTVYEKENRYPQTFLEEMKAYGENNGSRIAMLISPSWKWTDRLIYYSGNKEMAKADSLATDNRWDEAARIWTRMAKSNNKNIAAKATYNMALACEMLGHLELALEWVSVSYHVYNNEAHKQNCKAYIDILATRLQQERKLKKQFGG